jgi:hypothetical protein
MSKKRSKFDPDLSIGEAMRIADKNVSEVLGGGKRKKSSSIWDGYNG